MSDELSFVGIPTFLKRPFTRNLENVDVAIIGAPLDQGVMDRPGTRFGPRALREASQMWGAFLHPKRGMYDVELDQFILKNTRIIDYGDVTVVPTLCEMNLDAITREIRKLVNRKIFPIVLGGDHSISFAVVKAFKNVKMDVVQFDSHLDFLDESSGLSISHANPMKRIADLESVDNITQIGIRGFGNPVFMAEAAKKAGSKIITAETALKNGMDWVIDQVPKAENMYVTIDIDVLDPTHAPGTGTPEPGGFNYLQMREMLRKLPDKGKIIGFDVVEVNPLFDQSQITAQVAVRLIIDLVS